MPLWQLNKAEVEKLVTHWRNRPHNKVGERCSYAHSKHMIACLFSFLDWLDESLLKWRKPKGKINRKIVKLSQDNKQRGFGQVGPDTFSVEQLAKLAKAADNNGKLILALSVNCAFGAAEVGRLTEHCFFSGVHPHSELLGIESNENDWFCYFNRPKSSVYGEWLLWDEVVPLIEWGIARSREVGQERLILSKRNTPLFRDHAQNAQTGFASWFNSIREKIHGEFPKHPYGTIRKTLPTILRRDYSQEIASVCLAHGETGNDDLIHHYTTRPYGGLHNAIRELKEMFQPFLDELSIS